ncbi:50S ribosomal protein L7/L12 [Nicoliella lavandulae]|uniref:Large ribosomal subunit protein bL12 n=1 Tax=Nicoliella lavandulae TaxID=3082954 RepID=A0ABU8SJY0_9LACO
MAFDKDNIIAQLKDASITDLNDLVKSIEDEFGVSAAAPVAAAGAAGGDAAAKDSFDVELTSAGSAKIKAIKAVREITGAGLKEAKDLVDGAPAVVKEGASEEEANKIKEQLEAAGATVTLK